MWTCTDVTGHMMRRSTLSNSRNLDIHLLLGTPDLKPANLKTPSLYRSNRSISPSRSLRICLNARHLVPNLASSTYIALHRQISSHLFEPAIWLVTAASVTHGERLSRSGLPVDKSVSAGGRSRDRTREVLPT